MISPIERERLAAILGMLGSDAAGERDNAARAAHKFVRQRGLTWIALIHPPGTLVIPAKPAVTPPPRPPPSPAPPAPGNARGRLRAMGIGAFAAFWLIGAAYSLFGVERVQPLIPDVHQPFLQRVR